MAGGLFCGYCDSVVIINNNISGNYTFYAGGGIGLWGTNALLLGNMISGNDAYEGGGIFIYISELTVIGNLIRMVSHLLDRKIRITMGRLIIC